MNRLLRFRRWLRYKLGLRLATIDFRDDQEHRWRVIVKKGHGELLRRVDERWLTFGDFTDIDGPIADNSYAPVSRDYIPKLRNASVRFLMADGSSLKLRVTGKVEMR